MIPIRPNLMGFSLAQLTDWFIARGEKPFRAKQVHSWIHQHLEHDFLRMSNVAKTLQATLSQEAEVVEPLITQDTIASDGTRKWLTSVGSGNAIESVFIPEETRGTLCVSSQAGCALECAFCSTGKQGFNRNLSSAEIIGQLWMANRLLRTADNVRPITNVVMMGMGEPLANFDNVVSALQIMLEDHAYGLSRRRVTVSTAGIVPAIDRLRDACPVALAVSLHAPTDALRDRLVPINKKYPLKELLDACVRYLDKAPRDFITFEYVMLKDVNDSVMHARQLVDLVSNVPCKFNLIPWNPYPNAPFQQSSATAIRRFSDILIESGLVTTVRKTRGEDIDAACGQLAGQVQDKTRRVIQRIAISSELRRK